jgi:hypothetical protein
VVRFEDVEEDRNLVLDARGMRRDYLEALTAFRAYFQTECAKASIDFVPIDTSINFGKALLQYLLQRQKRF